MKRLLIERNRSKNDDAGTFGNAKLLDEDEDGNQIAGPWHSLELPDRGNKTGISCVPEGLFHARLFDSPHFKRKVYKLYDVPDRDDVEVHPANWGGDVAKGLYTELHGCMALGKGTGVLTPPGGHMPPQSAITGSIVAIDEFMEACDGDEEIEIEVRWAP